MKHHFIEATSTAGNHGKFMVARFTDDDFAARSAIDGFTLIFARGWTPKHVLVLDLQTGEGAMFLPGGLASADLRKHRIWVCPLFEPFLSWLYEQPDLDKLPNHIDLGNVPFAMYGYRRQGPEQP